MRSGTVPKPNRGTKKDEWGVTMCLMSCQSFDTHSDSGPPVVNRREVQVNTVHDPFLPLD